MRNHHRRRRQRPVQRRKRPRSESDGIPINPFLVDRFQRVCEAAAEGRPVDIGVAQPGTVRFLTHSFADADPKDWVSTLITSHDRSLREWVQLFTDLKSWHLKTADNVSAPPFHPFIHRVQAGVYLESLFYKNMSLRWTIRKFLQRIRMRIMDRRHIGADADLYTTLPVPAGARVTIYDNASCSKYTFHTHTAIQILLTGLKYSSYGISHPIVPKNPYTNLIWTEGQLIELVGQISANLMRSHKVLPELLYSYCAVRYNLNRFLLLNRHTLHLHAATSFFQNKTDSDVLAITGEILDDLEEMDGIVRRNTWRHIRRCILLRSLPADLMTRWDRLVLATWVWDNHQIVYEGFGLLFDMKNEFALLYAASEHWWNMQPRRILQRASPPGVNHINAEPDTNL